MVDADGDGFTEEEDCDDTNGFVNPDAYEVEGDGLDNDCDGLVDEDTSTEDLDGDGVTAADGDCDDTDAAIHPGSTEIWYDGVDQNCDDTDEAVHPGAAEDCESGIDSNCDGYAGTDDNDGDGYAACEECNDGDAEVSPSADEVCDEVDNDCDGVVDDDPVDGTPWYGDADGDGFGDLSDLTMACDGPSGLVDNPDDCDDADAQVNPDAQEVCNGLDDDCDGLVDSDDDSVDPSTVLTWYADTDGDGFGDPDDSVESCDQPSGYVADDTDCDDDDATLRPDNVWYEDTDGDGYGGGNGTTQCEPPSGDSVLVGGDCDDGDDDVNPGETEVCDDDDTDEDCDGLVDDDDPSVTGTTTWYSDADGDGFGDSSDAGTGYCDPPSAVVSDHTDCDDTDADVNPDEDEVSYNGIDDDCNDRVDDMVAGDEALWTILGENSNHGIGSGGVYMSEDANGDGSAELLIATPWDDSQSTNAGGVAFHDEDTLGIDVDFSDGWALITGRRSYDYAGTQVALLGDVDGDGDPEYAMGAAGYGDYNGGIVWIFDLDGVSGENQARDIDQGYIYGESYNGELGYALAAGDMDGDGDMDLAVGSPGYYYGRGRVYVALYDDGYSSDGLDSGDPSVRLSGTSYGDGLGTAVLLANDLTGSGYDDLVACSPGRTVSSQSDAGVCYIVEGDSSPDVSDGINDEASVTISGDSSDDDMGSTPFTLAASDLDGDGNTDLAVGVPGYSNTGAVWVYFGGGLSGNLDIGDADVVIVGDGEAGVGLVGGQDIDDDGNEDLLLGDLDGEGTVYLLAYGASGSLSVPGDEGASWEGDSSGDDLGAASSGLEDLDDDGQDEFAIAAPANDDEATSAGKVYVVPGY